MTTKLDLTDFTPIYPKAHWPVHSLALLFPPKPVEERLALKQSMIDRVLQGLPPLEHPLLLYERKTLDGRHRDEIWCELAAENACDGYFSNNRPPTEEIDAQEHGLFNAYLRVSARNNVVRQMSQDVKAAVFLLAADEFPEIQNGIDAIKARNAARQLEGRPLDAGDQRGDTVAEMARIAVVGRTTMNQMLRLKRESPEVLHEIIAGTITAKKALMKLKSDEIEESEDAEANQENDDGPRRSTLQADGTYLDPDGGVWEPVTSVADESEDVTDDADEEDEDEPKDTDGTDTDDQPQQTTPPPKENTNHPHRLLLAVQQALYHAQDDIAAGEGLEVSAEKYEAVLEEIEDRVNGIRNLLNPE